MRHKNFFYLLIIFLMCNTFLMAQSNDSLEAKIQKFWDFIKKNEIKFYDDEQSNDEDYESLDNLIKGISENLDAIVMINTINDKRRFIITSYGNKEYFQLAERVLEKAPDLKYLYPFALFPPIPDVIPYTIDDKPLELKDIKVHFDAPIDGKYDILLLLPESHRVNITYDTTDQYYEAYWKIVFNYMIQLFGEKLLVEKISAFDLYQVNVAIKDISLLEFYEFLLQE